jgi:hypothetical protein
MLSKLKRRRKVILCQKDWRMRKEVIGNKLIITYITEILENNTIRYQFHNVRTGIMFEYN